MKNTMLVIVLLMITSACNPVNRKFHPDSYYTDIDNIQDAHVVSWDDLNLIRYYIKGAQQRGENIDGFTYRQLLDSGRAEKKWEDDYAERIKQERRHVQQEFKKTLRVALTGFIAKPYMIYQVELCYVFLFINLSDHCIRAFEGTAVITDVLGNELYKLNIVNDNQINIGTHILVPYYSHHLPPVASEGEKQLFTERTADNLRVQWKPKKIIFLDGSSLEMPE